MSEDKKDMLCNAGEFMGEVIMGYAVGKLIANHVSPKCKNGFEETMITAASCIAMWTFCRKSWAPTWYKFCDVAFGTDHECIIEKL